MENDWLERLKERLDEVLGVNHPAYLTYKQAQKLIKAGDMTVLADENASTCQVCLTRVDSDICVDRDAWPCVQYAVHPDDAIRIAAYIRGYNVGTLSMIVTVRDLMEKYAKDNA